VLEVIDKVPHGVFPISAPNASNCASVVAGGGIGLVQLKEVVILLGHCTVKRQQFKDAIFTVLVIVET
jgi:hypothetical protein